MMIRVEEECWVDGSDFNGKSFPIHAKGIAVNGSSSYYVQDRCGNVTKITGPCEIWGAGPINICKAIGTREEAFVADGTPNGVNPSNGTKVALESNIVPEGDVIIFT